jgi:hypothetical protein
MITNPIIIIFLLFSALIPIVIWGYLFSYFDAGEFNRKRFFYWILAWIVSVFPVLYLWDIIDNFSLGFLNIFKNVYNLNNFSWVLWLFISLFSFIILISIIPFFINIFGKNKSEVLVLLKNTVIFLFFMLIVSLIFYFLKEIFWNISFSNTSLSTYPNFWSIAFNSASLVIFYYLIIWLIEEVSKFFSFNYSKNFKIVQVKQWVLFAIFTALWFAFFENILYFHTMIKNYSIGKEFLWVYFSRNLFSVFLHIICSSIFAYYFWLAYLKYYNKLKYIQILFIWFILSVFFHSIFDIFLTFDMTFIIFLYFIGWYFYLSYIFYSRD